MPDDQVLESLKMDEARRPTSGAVSAAVSVADDVESELAVGRLIRSVYLTDRRRLEPSRPGARSVPGHSGRWIGSHLFLVSFCRSAVFPAVPVERGEEDQVAGPHREDPRKLADQ